MIFGPDDYAAQIASYAHPEPHIAVELDWWLAAVDELIDTMDPE